MTLILGNRLGNNFMLVLLRL